MKRFIAFFVFVLFAVIAFSQSDTTIIVNPPGEFPADGGPLDWVTWLVSNWDRLLGTLMALLSVLELILRVIPTPHDWSLIGKIIDFLDDARFLKRLTKNRAMGGGVYKRKVVQERE